MNKMGNKELGNKCEGFYSLQNCEKKCPNSHKECGIYHTQAIFYGDMKKRADEDFENRQKLMYGGDN